MFTLQASLKQLLLGGGGGVKSVCRGDFELQGGKLFRLLSQLRPRIRPRQIGDSQFLRTFRDDGISVGGIHPPLSLYLEYAPPSLELRTSPLHPLPSKTSDLLSPSLWHKTHFFQRDN